MRQIVARSLPLALLLGAIGQAKADTITFTGSIYQSGDSTIYGASPTSYSDYLAANPGVTPNPVIQAAYSATVDQPTTGSLAGINPDATFTTTSINYASDGTTTPYTLNGFLGSPGYSNTSMNFATGDVTPQTSNPAYGGNASLNNTYILLTGYLALTTGETLIVTHDDGASLTLSNGQSFASGPPTYSKQDSITYTGPDTVVGFSLAYGEVAGAPADLILTATDANGNPIVITPSAVPEPASLAMMAIGFVAIGGYRLRRRKLAAA